MLSDHKWSMLKNVYIEVMPNLLSRPYILCMYICAYTEEEKVTNLSRSKGAWQEFEGGKGG